MLARFVRTSNGSRVLARDPRHTINLIGPGGTSKAGNRE